jgi:hypothetical protein
MYTHSASNARQGQVNMISVVIIAGMIIALVGAAYTWATPMIEKRITVADYRLVENFMVTLNKEIIKIANTGSGEARIPIPKGKIEIKGYDYMGEVNNTITLDFEVSQPIMVEGTVPIKTSSLDYVGEYGKAEPRIIMLSRTFDFKYTRLNMTMMYRELRSSTPRGYVIALCPSIGSL